MMKGINNTYKYILALTGISYILYYIWFRFFRLRLPRGIPFDLTIFSFLILFIICATYFYIIYRYVNPKVPHPFILQIISYISQIFIPLYALNDILIHNRFLKKFIIKGLYRLAIRVNNLTVSIPFENKYSGKRINPRNDFNFHIKYRIFPKLFILVILIIDIFYFHRLDYFYISITLGAYYLFWQYIMYTTEILVEDTIKYLQNYYFVYIIPQDKTIEEDYFHNINDIGSPIKYYTYRDFYEDDNYFYDEQIETYNWDSEYYDVEYLTNVRDFVESQSLAIYYNETPYIYTCIERPIARKEFCTKHHIKTKRLLVTLDEPPCDDLAKELAKNFHKLMPFAIEFNVFIKHKHRDKHEDIKNLEIIILCGHLICWSYILIVSLHTLNVLDIIELLANTYKYEQPL